METDLHHPSPQKSHPCTSSATFSNSRSMKTRVSHPNRPMADKHHGHHQNGPSSSQSASVPSWKKMPTPIGFDPKENLFRVHGVCKEYPEYNVRDVRDPRIQKFKANNVMELPVPDFLVDDQYTAVPTNREFSITGLNDNIDEKFLRSLCKSDPAQVIVFHHPKTRRHLGLAFMDFNTKAESEAFIKKFNGKTLMGGKVNCFFDPLAYEISKLHAEATGGFVVPMPERYTHLITSKSICRMRDLVKKHYGDGQQDDSPVFIKQEHVVGKKAITPPEIEQAPAATNGTSSAKKCSQTPSGSQPRPATLKDAADLSLELDKTHVNHDGHTSCTSLSTSTTNFALSNSNGRPLNSHLMADPVTDQDQENVTSLDESLDNFPRRMSRFKRHLLSEHLQSAVDLQNQPISRQNLLNLATGMVDSSVFGASTRLFLLPSPLPSNKLELENGEIDVEEEDLRAVVSLETAKMRITNTHNQFHSLDEETQESPPTPFLDRSEINGSICMTPAFATPCLTHVCASLEHKEVLEATIISLNSVARNDSEPASKPKPNKTRSQQAIDSDCSLSTSSSSSSKTYSSSSPAPNYSRLKSKSSQKKSLNHCSRLNHHLTTDTEPILDKALQRVSSPSDCSPIYNQNSSQRSKHKPGTSGKEQNGSISRSRAPKTSSSPRKKRPSSRTEKKEESRKYRWSSSSSADSRCSNRRKDHKTVKRKPKRPSTPPVQEEILQNIQLPPTPTPPIFSPSIAIAPSTSFNHPKVAIQSPAITSTSSPTQPAVKPLHQQNLPPPGLIMPPTPVGLVPIRQPPLVKVEEVAGTPKPMSLEQRLNAMFKKGAIRKEKSNEIPIELVKLESPEDQNIKMEGHEENSPVIDLSMMSPSTSRVRDTIANHLVGSTSPRNPFRNRLMQIAKHDEVKQETQQEVESEQAKKARLDAQLVKERHQKIQRCVDVSRQARSTFSVEMIMVLHKDIQRRLEAEALKILDEKYQALEEKRRQEAKQLEADLLSSAKHNGLNATLTLSNLNQPLASLFPALDASMNNNPDEGMAASETIFGIPYQVRMASLPSFKKKKPAEFQNSYAKDRLHHIKKKREQEEIQRKSSRRNQTRSSSELSEDKMVRKKSKGSQLVRRVLHKRSLSSSSSASRSSSNSSSICVSRRKRNDVSVNASSRISSADEAEPITDSEADEQEVQKSEQQIEKEKEKTLLDKKRAILDSLLKGNRDEEDDDSCSLQSSLTPPPECLPGDQTPKSTKPEVLENHRSAPSTPPPVKKAKTSKELASLLHSSSDFIAPQKPVVKKEPKVWALRDPDAELNLMHNFEISHLSSEDCTYFKLAILKLEPQFEEQGLLPPGKKLVWNAPNPVVKQPRELPAPIKKDKCEFYFDDHELEGIVPHKSGCARTEGFYKISKQRKTLMRRHEDYANRTIISTQDETAVRHMTQAAKDERAMNRRLLTWIGDSALVRVNQLKYRSKMIKFARSQMHGWGLYALETIPPEVMIIEYVGEKIRPTVADEREKSYELRGMGSSYMFRIDGDAVIDATKQGNFGRFINHSCSPNCTARVVLVDGDKRIVIYSKRLISKGEEITYDYKFAREEEASKIECLCGSKCCQKFLN